MKITFLVCILSFMDNITNFGLFMITGLPFLAKVLNNNSEVDENILKDFVEKLSKIDINVKVDNTDIIVYFKNSFICKVSIFDYQLEDKSLAKEITI